MFKVSEAYDFLVNTVPLSKFKEIKKMLLITCFEVTVFTNLYKEFSLIRDSTVTTARRL